MKEQDYEVCTTETGEKFVLTESNETRDAIHFLNKINQKEAAAYSLDWARQKTKWEKEEVEKYLRKYVTLFCQVTEHVTILIAKDGYDKYYIETEIYGLTQKTIVSIYRATRYINHTIETTLKTFV